MLAKGVFTISIDYEFAWGYADRKLSVRERELVASEVAITKRLLELFAKCEIKATWAIVGHLLERSCTWQDSVPHPEYARPVHQDDLQDWFRAHPAQGSYDDAGWFDTESLIPEIAKQGHEIGSHSYAHIHYGLPETREVSVRTDLENVRRVHLSHGYEARSFVFPRNYEGYHELLREYGVEAYRGVTPRFYHPLPRPLRKLFHYLSYFLISVPLVVPIRTRHDLINIPDSMLLFSRGGLRKLISRQRIELKAKRGIDRAAQEKKLFHLWFHPSNFWHDTEVQFEILEAILRHAAALRDSGKLEVLTMGEAAKLADI